MLYHFNWGWEGSNDGYFLLDGIDFDKEQKIIINLIPTGPEDSCKKPVNLTAQYDFFTEKVMLHWENSPKNENIKGFFLSINNNIIEPIINDTFVTIPDINENQIFDVSLHTVCSSTLISDSTNVVINTYSPVQLSTVLNGDSIATILWTTAIPLRTANTKNSFVYDFENYPENTSILVADTASRWKRWLGGNDLSPISTTRGAHSGKSLHMTKESDLLLILGQQYTGKHIFQFDIFVKNNAVAHWNFQKYIQEGIDWGLYMDIKDNGVFSYTVKSNIFNHAYDQNKWNTIKIKIDLNADSSCTFVNDSLITCDKWSYYSAQKLHTYPTFASVNFCGNGDSTDFFIDNITYSQIIDTIDYIEIYRNNQLIGTKNFAELNYKDTLKSFGNYTYFVKAFYNSGDSVISTKNNVIYRENITINSNEESDKNSFELSPNPVHRQLIIRNKNNIPFKKIELFNSSGVLVNTIIPNGSEQNLLHINMDQFPSGSYYITISTHRGTFHEKVVKY